MNVEVNRDEKSCKMYLAFWRVRVDFVGEKQRVDVVVFVAFGDGRRLIRVCSFDRRSQTAWAICVRVWTQLLGKHSLTSTLASSGPHLTSVNVLVRLSWRHRRFFSALASSMYLFSLAPTSLRNLSR